MGMGIGQLCLCFSRTKTSMHSGDVLHSRLCSFQHQQVQKNYQIDNVHIHLSGPNVCKLIALSQDFKELAKNVALMFFLKITMGMLNIAFAEKIVP